MGHIDNINIQTFRGIRNLLIPHFGDINVVVGDNNSGKTSLLEAIMILIGSNDISNIALVSRLRERYNFMGRDSLGLYDSFLYLFNKTQEELNIQLNGSIHGNEISYEICGKKVNLLVDPDELGRLLSPIDQRRLSYELVDIGEVEGFEGYLKYSNGTQSSVDSIIFHKYIRNIRLSKNKPLLISRFISPIDHIVNNNSRSLFRSSSFKREVVKALNIFDQNIIDISIIQEEGTHRYIQALEHRNLGMLPLSTFGDGMKRMVSLASGIVAAKNGILLVDELETSIHKKAMKEVFSWIFEVCASFNVQLFITTHSLEAVDEILYAHESMGGNLETQVITLVRKDDQSFARVLSSPKARQVRDDYDMELRL